MSEITAASPTIAALAAAHIPHGNYAAAARAKRRYETTVFVRTRTLIAAMQVREYLPADIRMRVELGSAELAPPPHNLRATAAPNGEKPPSETCPQAPIPKPPPGAAPRDARGRFASKPRPALRGRRAELQAARLERAMLAPWRAGIKRARQIKRLLMYQAQNARRANRAQHSTPNPLPSTCSPDSTQQPAGLTTAELPVTDPRHGETPAPGTRFKPARIEPLNPETAPNSAGPHGGTVKTSTHPGTVAPSTGPVGAADAGGDKYALHSRTVARPGGPGDCVNKPPMHRGTVAPSTGPAGAADACGDKHALHPGTVARPSGSAGLAAEGPSVADPPRNTSLAKNARIAFLRTNPVASRTATCPTTPGERTAKTSIHSGTVAPLTGPAVAADAPDNPALPLPAHTHHHDQDRSHAIHPDTVRRARGPFRRALLASTASNTPDAHRLAAQVERVGGWPVMAAAAAAKRAGLDWRPTATAVRQRLIEDADRWRAGCALRVVPVLDVARWDIAPWDIAPWRLGPRDSAQVGT